MSTDTMPGLDIKKMGDDTFTEEQKSYLDGFFAGIKNRGIGFAGLETDPVAAAPKKREKKKIPEERMKEGSHPFDAYPRLLRQAKTNAPPEKEDIFRYKWNGLFWLAPVHDGYMCRLRIPGGVVTAPQWRELADCTEELASGFGQITTRNNLQIRVIQPEDAPDLLCRVQSVGLHSRGSGADNLRNLTANPTAGIDPYEIIDVMPYVKELSRVIINSLEFYNLPRKFNISFDGGNVVRVAEDTNDIGFRAIKLEKPPEGHPLRGQVEAGVYFQILLGGITGHQEFAEDSGVICRADQAVEVAADLVRVFIENGNRGNRGKARMIYLLKEWGFAKYIEETEKKLGWKLVRFDETDPGHTSLVTPHEKPDIPHPHLGVHRQKQEGLSYIGVHVPMGQIPAAQMRAVADVAETYGSGEIRLTIFENLIIPDIPDGEVEAAEAVLHEAGLRCGASFVRGGMAACTGNRYCKFSSADTKGQGLALADYLDQNIELDQPVNVHITGCPHSCAQHYIGDVGLLACKVQTGEEIAEGFHVFVGGGFGKGKKSLGRQLFKSVVAGDELNRKMLALFETYLGQREGGESFREFTARYDIGTLGGMVLQKLEPGAA